MSNPRQTPLLGGAFAVQDGLSRNGRYVLFQSTDAYVPTKTTRSTIPGFPADEFYRHDFATGRTERVSVTSAGEERDGGLPTTAHMTPDGRFVVFDSRADFTAPTRAPACSDGTVVACPNRHVFVRDMATGITTSQNWTYDGRPAAEGFAEGAAFASISSSGRYVTFISNALSMYPGQPARGQPGDAWWTYLRDRGPVSGVGELVAARTDGSGDVSAGFAPAGADITGASLLLRPANRDLYVRIRLAQLPSYDVTSPAVVYVCDLSVNGTRYEVRVSSTATGPDFGLYRRTTLGGVRTADLHGGVGTTGDEVVVAVPLASIGAAHGARIGDVSVATGIGTQAAGLLSIVDTVTMR
jgi:hypothetical protein